MSRYNVQYYKFIEKIVFFVTLSNKYCFHDTLKDCDITHPSIKLLLRTEGPLASSQCLKTKDLSYPITKIITTKKSPKITIAG